MTNFTGSILEQKYNLTPLMDGSIVEDPPSWLANFNLNMGGFFFVTTLYIFVVVLFLVIRRRDEVKDSEAALYAGFIGSIIGVLTFLIQTGVTEMPKLITWGQLLPVIVLTAVMVIFNYINRNY